MPAPTWRANSTFASATASLTMTFPTGYQVNDILVLAVTGANGSLPAVNQTNLTNNGWARVQNTNTRIGTTATTNLNMDIWWTRASTTSQTAVVLGDSGDHTLSVCAAFSNVIATGDPWDGPQLNVSNTTAVAQVTSYNVTTSSANSLVLTIIAGPRDIAAGQVNASPVLVGGSGGDTELTERCDYGTTSGGGSTIAILTHRKPTAGATANVRANTLTAQTAITWTGALIALADAVIRPRSQVIII
jgi:hypothetical protein